MFYILSVSKCAIFLRSSCYYTVLNHHVSLLTYIDGSTLLFLCHSPSPRWPRAAHSVTGLPPSCEFSRSLPASPRWPRAVSAPLTGDRPAAARASLAHERRRGALNQAVK
jgi:hypothetical protein